MIALAPRRGEGVAPAAGAIRPLRIGFWCDYGTTLTPHEGIGVFVHNLMAGLLALERSVEVVALVRHGEQGVMAPLQARHPERLRVLPASDWAPPLAPRAFPFTWAWIAASDRARTLTRAAAERLEAFEGRLCARGKELLREVLHSSGVLERGLALARAALALPVLAAAGWAGSIGRGLAAALWHTLGYPLALLDRAVRSLGRSAWLSAGDLPVRLAHAADCDLWVIPYVGFEQTLDFPAVVFIHDLVVFHYPDFFDPRLVKRLREVVPARAREAVVCACMSDFIRRHDLLGVLGLPAAKVRMVPPAPPADFPPLADEQAALLRPARLVRPYLLYPAAFRGYKNHRALIEALRHLRDAHGDDRFDLVFTGARAGELPPDLDALARAARLRERVHVLGRVDRLALAALYKGACATVVPSRYEQGSFPIYEALHWSCPVACADIPALREQCAALGATIPFFDPDRPDDLAAVVRAIAADRETIRRRQVQAAAAVWRRTWTDVAREWLPVFEEVARKGCRPVTP